MRHERYKPLCHKITCVHCTLPIWQDYYLLKLIGGRKSGVLGELG